MPCFPSALCTPSQQVPHDFFMNKGAAGHRIILRKSRLSSFGDLNFDYETRKYLSWLRVALFSTTPSPYYLRLKAEQRGINSSRRLLRSIQTVQGDSHGHPETLVRESSGFFDELNRSLLRCLLRECRRLPDPAAASYLHQHILSRFRDYHLGSDAHQAYSVDKKRLVELYKRAKRNLNQLRAANAGFSKPLLKTLMLTYGRTGKRRHDFLKPLLRHGFSTNDPSQDYVVEEEKPFEDPVTKALNAHPNTPHPTHLARIPRLTASLTTLLRSQQLSSKTRNNRLPRLQLEIPERNAWKAPLAQTRVKNAATQWYADIMEKALPPLPKKTWQRLQGLASGGLRFAGWDNRGRAVILGHEMGSYDGGVIVSKAGKPWNLSSQKHGEEEREESALEVALGIDERGPLKEREKGRSRPHHITPRFMKRLWQRVFELCPTMKWDEAKRRWNIRWGAVQHARVKVRASPDGSNSSKRTDSHLRRVETLALGNAKKPQLSVT